MNNYKLVVNSSLLYKNPINSLLKSIEEAKEKINQEDIIIFQSGGTEYKYSKYNNYTSIVCDNNTFDLTSFIAIKDLDLQFEWFFYIHDTCVVGKDFFNKIKKYDKSQSITPLKNGGGSMNFGMYNVKYVKDNSHLFYKYKNKDYSQEGLQKAKSDAVRTEGIFFNDKNFIPYEGNGNPILINNSIKYYQTENTRILEYFQNIDLYKIKANYQGWQSRWNIDE